ncbi:hypothetical protein [Mycobacterium sp. OAE908]
MARTGAWPETDEDVYTNRANELDRILSKVDATLSKWQNHQASIFNGPHVWSGDAATKAGAAVEGATKALQVHRQQLWDAREWCRSAATNISSVKDTITTNVEAGQLEIADIEKTASRTNHNPDVAIRNVVERKYSENVRTVESLAAGLGWKPDISASPADQPAQPGRNGERQDGEGSPSRLLRSDPSANPSGGGAVRGVSAGGPPSGSSPVVQPVSTRSDQAGNTAEDRTATAAGGSTPQPVSAWSNQRANAGAATGTPPVPSPSVVESPPTGIGAAPAAPNLGGSAPSVGGGPSGSPGVGTPSSPLSTSSGSAGSAPGPSVHPTSGGQGAPTTDGAQAGAQAGAGGQPTGTAPQTTPFTPQVANTPMAAQPPIPPAPTPGPAPIPDAPPPTPSAPAPAGAPAGHVAPPPAPSVGAAPAPAPAPGPSMPLGPPPTPPPAAPLAPPGSAAPAPTSMGPGVAPASAAGATSAVGAPAPVPVSAARAERDAIAAAATAGALRRQSGGGSDPLQLARRIGAALNAEPNIDFGFFWVTALTHDGQIVVANSYGLGYIPDGVNLPEQVRMASADESIPLGERAKWATYPILAVQGWAQHHNLRLRAVVATEDQFKNFDPGTAKVILRSDDIPDSGKMQGRNRLAVIAPEAASRLAGVSANALSELLPPAPSDTNPPADETSNLWFEVMKPMMSTNPERGVAHLEAFVNYADHAQEQALYRAHTAPDAAAQRGAIADWVYWQHVSVLISDALAGSAAK